MKKSVLFLVVSFFLISLVSASSSIGIDWIYPTQSISVEQNEFFNITVNASCFGENCGEINVSLDPTGTVYNFTTCGKTGRVGPNQSLCDLNYSETTLEGLVNVANGIQNWTVPASGTYTIEVAGAGFGAYAYQKGAVMSGTFELRQGDILSILVGQIGTNVYSGSGGTFVAFVNNTPLIVAGGAGGGNANHVQMQGVNTTNGASDNSGTYLGGTNGNGGQNPSGSCYAESGAGFTGNGGGCDTAHAQSFINGGVGALSYSANEGGFGGGGTGAQIARLGGGGGYSGGGSTDSISGGGGGSYNSGTEQINTVGINAGTGYVTIISSAQIKNGLISTIEGTLPFYTNTTNPYNLTLSEGESQIITWLVNATGTLNIYEFFVYANQTSNISVYNETSKLNITIIDTNEPSIEISYPSNIVYNSVVTQLNYSYSDLNSGHCWYSINEGVTNSSAVSAGTNFTGLSSVDGLNSWVVYCNDSSGNLNSTSVSFTQRIPYIGLEIVYPSGNVNVTQNDTFSVSARVNCFNGDCGEINVTLMGGTASYSSCEDVLDSGETESGIYTLCPDGENCFNVYCNLTNGGFASIFQLENNLTLNETQCIFNSGNDDHDSYTLWEDYTLKLAMTNLDTTNGANWYTWLRNGTQNTTLGYLSNRPSGIGTSARPVPLPAMNKTIWFDYQNSRIIWDVNTNITFASVGLSTIGSKMNTPYTYDYYFITDGVNNIHAGYKSGSAVLLTFDFNNNTIENQTASVLSPSGGWWTTEEDAFGHILWTVNGRVMYYKGSGVFTLGGNLTSPNSPLTDLPAVTQNASPSQPGLDFFGRVDENGSLWFVDWGHDNGGYFNCGNDNYLGTGKTNIQLVSSDTISGGGIISNNIGQTPFYTTIQNPYNLTLNEDGSQIITWTINATGELYSTHEFYIYANSTSNSEMRNTSASWNVTIATEPSCVSEWQNTSWSSWQNQTGCLVNNTILQNRSLIQYDTVCASANVTFLDYQEIECDFCIPSLANSSWSDWINISCVNNLINQSRERTQYDSNFCGEVDNQTFLDYRQELDCSISLDIVSPANTTYNNQTQLVNISSGGISTWYNWNGTNISYSSPVYVLFAEGSNTLTTYANNSFSDIVSFSRVFGVDTIAPTIEIISPENVTYNTTRILLNVSAEANRVWYNWNGTNVTYTSANYIYFLNGSQTIYVYANDSVGNLNVSNVTFFCYADEDFDNIRDEDDRLIGNEKNIDNTGISEINLTVGGNHGVNSSDGVKEIVVYESSSQIINFSHNFSQSILNFSQISITKAENSLIVNLSGQLQGNKTLYIEDNNFVDLCVKDGEVSSISELSSGCDGVGEIDFTSCLGGSANFSGINCTDEGSRIRISNLQYSAIRGIPRVTIAPTSESGGSSSIGGSSLAPCRVNWSCDSWSFCNQNNTQLRTCEDINNCGTTFNKPSEARECPNILFDSLVEVKTKKIYPWTDLILSINLKEVTQPDLVDVKVIYRISKNQKVVYEESETKAIQKEISYIKTFLGLDLSPGEYVVEVIVEYGKNQTSSSEQNFKVIGSTTLLFWIIIFFLVGALGYLLYRSIGHNKEVERKLEIIEEKLENCKGRKATGGWWIDKVESLRIRSLQKRKEKLLDSDEVLHKLAMLNFVRKKDVVEEKEDFPEKD